MCKEIKGINASADVGEYLGFKLNVTFDSFNNKFVMNVKGAMSHPMEVGSDPLGNITRINNVLEAMPSQLEEAQMKLSNVKHQLETAKAEVDKPFPQEAELAEKLERLAELNSLLNMDEKGDDAIGMDDEATEPEKPQEDVKKWITGRKWLRICQSSRAIWKKQHQKENADLQTDLQTGLHCKKNSQQ